MKNKKAYFAGGCFWGVEHCFKNKKGVVSTRVGYMGGDKENPSYKEVCRKDTGHAETVEVIYNPQEISFKELSRFFFNIHNPTQEKRQGVDIRDQYRSAIFYTDSHQKKISQELISTLKNKGYNIKTELKKTDEFWKAKEYHQNYFSKKGRTPTCSVKERFN